MTKNKNIKIDALTGAGAAAYAMKQIKPSVVAAYPITPQTQIIEDFAYYNANGEIDSEIIKVESEHSAISACAGASSAGVRSMTASSSAGLMLMTEVLSIVSGLRLPIIMNVVNRAISGPINIHCDHSDSMMIRDSGWIQIFSETPEEVYHNNLIATKLSEKVLVPSMVLQDGFETSHSTQRVELLKDSDVNKYIGDFKPKYSLLDIKNPITIGPLQLFDYQFETKYQSHKVSTDVIKQEFIKASEELEKLTSKKYFFFDQYESKDADHIIICTSSTAGSVKQVVDDLRKTGLKVGLIKMRLYRPFPYNELKTAIKNVKNIAVLDRTFSFGSVPPLFKDVSLCLSDSQNIQSYVFGLGGRTIFEKDIKKVFEDLIKNKTSNDKFESSTKMIGCRLK